ncbi:hypothetical protein PRZ48_006237 [Zasmidium cellare]|uniref:Rhodopsin domain-containing protein n=1 Tax=Zasmidium cellare TaxID=395010 RepID=A0ABR0ENH9_ZASCE|nr:hypothetical protein PRZ48_006237 [Zasmidium cellare]
MSNSTTILTTDPWTTTIPNKTPLLLIVSTVFLTLSTLFFATRLIYRHATHQRGWDDLMALLAYLTLVIQTAFLYASCTHGFGKHRANLPPQEFSTAVFYFYLYQICYKMIGGFTKLNFCFLYVRIFGREEVFTRIVHWNTAIIAAGSVAFTVGTIFQCMPIKYNWDNRGDGYCISNLGFWYSHAGFNTLMDIVFFELMIFQVFLLPMWPIWKLHMLKRRKLGLIAVFGLGAFTIAASVVRMAMLYNSAKSTGDPTWGSVNGWLWTEIEANTAVICCCLPALRSLFVQFWRWLCGKSGPETPTNSGNPKKSPSQSQSQTQHLVRHEEPTQPSHSRYFGNFSEVKVSPPGSSQNLVDKPTRTWRPFNYHRKSGSGSSETELEEGNALVGSTAPRLDLGSIYKTMDVHVQSNRDSREVRGWGEGNENGKGEEEVSLREILREK